MPDNLEILIQQRENIGRRKELLVVTKALVDISKANPHSDAVPLLDSLVDDAMARLLELQDEYQELKCQISQTS